MDKIKFDRVITGIDILINGDVISFQTKRHGLFEVGADIVENEIELIEFFDEPALDTFSESERKYIRCVCAIVCRIGYDSKHPDFDKHKL